MSATLIKQFDLLATSTGGIAKLRELILSLAVRGQLVPQDPADEPASELLKKIRTEKDRLIAEGKIKRDKPLADIGEDEKPYELPVGWEWVRLGEVIEVIRGITFPASEKTKEPAPGRIACLRTANVQERIEWDDLLFVDRSFMGREEQVIAQQDIVMSMANSRELVGKVAIIENIPVAEATFGGFLSVLRPILVLPKFAMVMLRTGDARSSLIDSSSQTTNIANISLAKLRPLLFPLPPLSEQTRIIAKVEELMALCDRLEAEQGHAARVQGHWVEAALDQLAESTDADEFRRHWQHLAEHFDTLFTTPESIERLNATLLQLAVRGKLVAQDPNDPPASELLKQIRAEKDRLILEGKIKRNKPLPPITDDEKPYALPAGWEWVRMQDAFDVRDGTHDTPKYVDLNGIPLITSRNFIDGSICFEDAKLISLEDHEAIKKRSNVERGDILYSMIGGNIGNQVLVETDREFSIKNVALFKYYSAQLTRPEYLDLFLKTVTLNLQSRAVGGAQPFVSLSLLRNIVVPLAPAPEQSRIVTQVEKLLALTAELKARLSAAQTKQAHLAETLIAEVC